MGGRDRGSVGGRECGRECDRPVHPPYLLRNSTQNTEIRIC